MGLLNGLDYKRFKNDTFLESLSSTQHRQLENPYLVTRNVTKYMVPPCPEGEFPQVNNTTVGYIVSIQRCSGQ